MSFTTSGLRSLGDNLDSYIDANYSGLPVMDTEFDKRDLNDLAEDNSIPGIRIGWTQDSETDQVYIGAGQLMSATLNFTIQLFMNVARVNDYDRNVEFEIYDLKDVIFNWLQQLDVTFYSEYYLYTLNWEGVSFVDRQPEYSVMEFRLQGIYNKVDFLEEGIEAWIIEKTFIVQ